MVVLDPTTLNKALANHRRSQQLQFPLVCTLPSNNITLTGKSSTINLSTFTATAKPADDGASLEIRETRLKISGEKESVQQAVPFTNADSPYNE